MVSSMGSRRHRWKFSFHSRSPSSPSSPASCHSSPKSITAVSSPPSEFLCPISGELMADPVILPSGHTFERACILACDDLHVTPPSLPSSLHRPLQLIPNSALRSAIFSWCDRESHPRPVPITADCARHLVCRLFPIDSTRLAESSSSSPDAPPLVPESSKKKTSGSSYSSSSTSTSTLSSYNSSSSYSSTEIVPVEVEDSSPAPDTSLEDEILDKMIIHQEEAMAAILHYSRESGDFRAALCTPRILAALRPLLLSRDSCVQSDAAAAVVNLSLEQVNKVLIVRAGIVPALVDALRCGGVEARDHAAGALFSLAINDDNRVALGVLGAVPPLLALLCKPSEPPRARRDAGMALCHLSQSFPNKSKIAHAPGAVKSLIAVAAEKGELGLGKVALMILCNIAGSSDGRAAMTDGGAVAGVVGLLMGDVAAAEKEKCVATLYGMSRGSLRFRGLAREAGAEEALRRVAADDESGEAAKEMAERTMRAVTGEENLEEMMAVAAEGGVVSDGVLSFPWMYRRDFSGDRAAAAAANSAEF